MPRITRNLCGCDDCRNATGYTPEGDPVPCCEHCAEPPCEYLVLWGCDIVYTSPTHPNPEILRGTAIHALRRECPFSGCVWTGHRGQGYAGGVPANVAGSWSVCDHVDGGGWHWYPSSGQIKFPARYYDGDGKIQWGTPNFGCRPYGATDPHDCWWKYDANAADPLDPLNKTLIEWKLEITGASSATLTGYPKPGTGYDSTSLVYECNDFNCTGRSTFVAQDYPVLPFKAFPPNVCVVPGYTEFVNHCDSEESFCNCCDPGKPTAVFNHLIKDCSGDGTISAQTTCTRNATLPSGVSDPGGACGYFWGTATIDCTVSGKTGSFTFGFLVWCDGEDYQVAYYCNTIEGWVLSCTVTATLVRCCPEFGLEFSCASPFTVCCCEPDTGVETDCCPDDPIPSTVYVDLPAGCAQTSGVTATLTYQGVIDSRHTWSGTVSAGTCGTLYVTWSVGETGCDSRLIIDNDDTPLNGTCFLANDQLSCPFTSKTYTEEWSGGVCPCCSSGTRSATVSV